MALKYYEEVGNEKGMARSFQLIGEINSMEGNDSAALHNYFTSLKIFEKIGEKQSIGETLLKIGNTYFAQGNYTDALNKDSAALKIYKELGNDVFTADAYANMGRTYEKLGELDFETGKKTTAKNNFSEALKNYLLSLKLGIGDKGGLTWYYSYTASIYIKLHQLDSARLYLNMRPALIKRNRRRRQFRKKL